MKLPKLGTVTMVAKARIYTVRGRLLAECADFPVTIGQTLKTLPMAAEVRVKYPGFAEEIRPVAKYRGYGGY